MGLLRHFLFIIIAAGAVFAEDQDFTRLGGDLTSPALGPRAIQVFAPNVNSRELQLLQLSGFTPFHRFHTAAEGLGPRFVNSSCGGCHVQNGKGPFKFDHAGLQGGALVVKVKNPFPELEGMVGPVLQNHSTRGKKYHKIRVRWKTVRGRYADGKRYRLKAPLLSFSVEGRNYRRFKPSLRMTPPIIGPGLIEALSEEILAARADPDDRDNDGISGRLNKVLDLRTGTLAPGRFGYKAGQPTVEQQSAAALGNEMGLSNPLFPVNPDAIEFNEELLYQVTVYQKLGGVPAARRQEDPQVKAGRDLFFSIGCEACHSATSVTGPDTFTELAGQTIHPFSDFLLHDMGPGLADRLSEGLASGAEWKTTPLWGLGFNKYLSNVKPRYLHDGRARTLEEAILWHGGESKASRENFKKLTAQERQALLEFLNSL